MYNTKKYMRIKATVMANPIISMGSQEKTLLMAKVAVIKAVFGNMKENHAMEKIILP